MNQITASSQKLAELVQSKTMDIIGSNELGVKDQGVKSALFYVLLGARMPAILIECNFISNPHEEQLLASPEYREKLIAGIAAGIREYLKPAQK
jgi:N-acetylmuramoyl-L-alanine amidase